MSDWKERVQAELTELQARGEKLAEALHNSKQLGISATQVELMGVQMRIMNAYAAVLGARLNCG